MSAEETMTGAEIALRLDPTGEYEQRIVRAQGEAAAAIVGLVHKVLGTEPVGDWLDDEDDD